MKKIFLIFLLVFTFLIKVNASTTIDVIRKVDNVDSINNTFSYEIIPKDTNPDVVGGLINNFDIVFNESEVPDKIAQKSYTIDFSNFTFNKLGKYEFVLNEVSSSNEIDYPKDEDTYTIVVYVKNELNENSEPTGNFIIDVLQNAYVNDTLGKAEIIYETNALTYLTINKTVTGDAADMNEYFKFKLEIGSDNNLTISGQDETVTYNNEEISTSNVFDPSIENYVYLKHGQTVTIGLNSSGEKELLAGTRCVVEEMDSEDYKTYINEGTANSKYFVRGMSNLVDRNIVSYVNNKETTVLTGLFVNIIPFVILSILSIAGIVLVRKKVVFK